MMDDIQSFEHISPITTTPLRELFDSDVEIKFERPQGYILDRNESKCIITGSLTLDAKSPTLFDKIFFNHLTFKVEDWEARNRIDCPRWHNMHYSPSPLLRLSRSVVSLSSALTTSSGSSSNSSISSVMTANSAMGLISKASAASLRALSKIGESSHSKMLPLKATYGAWVDRNTYYETMFSLEIPSADVLSMCQKNILGQVKNYGVEIQVDVEMEMGRVATGYFPSDRVWKVGRGRTHIHV